MNARILISATLIFAAAACGPASTESDPKELADVKSMTLKQDGRYEVVCTNGSREIVTAEDAARGRLCPFDPSDTSSRITLIPDQAILTNRTEPVEHVNFGKDSWQGMISFLVDCTVCYESGRLTIQDGVGGKWVLKSNGQTTFSRLVTPVKVTTEVPGSENVNVKLRNITVESSAFTPPRGAFEKGRIDVGVRSPQFFKDLKGAKVTLHATAKFFRNFTAGNVCGRVEVVGADRRVVIDAVTDHVTIKDLVAPISIEASSTCQSSRLANPENAEADYLFSIPAVVVESTNAPTPPLFVPPTYEELKPVIDAHCIKCHNAERGAGRLALDAYPFTSARIADQKAIVTKMVERVRAQTLPMPPVAETSRPTEEEIARLEAWRDQGVF